MYEQFAHLLIQQEQQATGPKAYSYHVDIVYKKQFK